VLSNTASGSCGQKYREGNCSTPDTPLSMCLADPARRHPSIDVFSVASFHTPLYRCVNTESGASRYSRCFRRHHFERTIEVQQSSSTAVADHYYGESRRKPRASARGGCQSGNVGCGADPLEGLSEQTPTKCKENTPGLNPTIRDTIIKQTHHKSADSDEV